MDVIKFICRVGDRTNMKKFEYLCKYFVFGKTGMQYPKISEALSELGSQGWELVAVVNIGYGQIDYYFKREIQ